MEERNREALIHALRSLRRRDYLEAELRTALESRGFESETVSQVLQFLVERRFLDDSRTITQTVERWSGKRAIGRERIRFELIARGVPETVADEVAASVSEETEVEKMERLLAGKFRPDGDRVRAWRFLAGRGFDPDLAQSVCDRFFESSDSDADGGL